MRAYPHRPDEELALELKDEEKSLFQHVGAVSTAEPATTEERFWSRNAEKGLFCAYYAYAFEAPVEQVRFYLAQSNAGFATGLDRRAPFDLGALMDQVAAAVVLGDAALATRLCRLPPARYQVEGVTFEPIVPREFDVWKACVLGSGDAAANLARAEAGLAADKLPRTARDDAESMLALFKGLLARDAGAVNAALAQRANAFAKMYRSAAARDEPSGLLDLRGLALAALARRQGLAPAVDSVYLPLAVIAG